MKESDINENIKSGNEINIAIRQRKRKRRGGRSRGGVEAWAYGRLVRDITKWRRR